MLLAFLLASAGRCASMEACPTDEQLMVAVTRYHSDIAVAVAASLGEGTYIDAPPRSTRVRNVRCEAPVAEGGSSRVNCSFDYRHGRSRMRRVATLRRSGAGWFIDETLAVALDGR
jgi:hypothetical protein